MSLINMEFQLIVIVFLCIVVLCLLVLLLKKKNKPCRHNQNDNCVLRDVFDMAPFLLVVFDCKGRVLKVNKNSFYPIISNACYFEEIIDLVSKYSINVKENFKKEIVINVDGESDYWYLIENIKIGTDDLYYLMVIADITSQKEFECDLIVSHDKSLKVIEDQKRFLAVISHELRTPVSALIGLMELLLAKSIDKEQKELLFNAIGSAKRLESLVNDILDFSKINASQLKLNNDWESLPDLICPTLRLFESQAKNKELQFIVNWQPTLNWLVFTDGFRLNQILINILSNAIKFTEHGFVVVKVRLDKGKVWIHVKDSGIGINETELLRIYEPFVQADSGTTRKYGGTGLGLSIVHSLIQLMSGEITIESQEGVGTSISIELPIEMKKIEPIYSLDKYYVKDQRLIPWLKVLDIKYELLSNDFSEGLDSIYPDLILSDIKNLNHNSNSLGLEEVQGTVLVIEDDEINRFLMQKQLSQFGMFSYVSSSGREALDIFEIKGEEIDIIITDYHMPKMNGLELTINIRTMNNKGAIIPIVLLTADCSADLFDLASISGVTKTLHKPYPLSELNSTLKDLLKRDSLLLDILNTNG